MRRTRSQLAVLPHVRPCSGNVRPCHEPTSPTGLSHRGPPQPVNGVGRAGGAPEWRGPPSHGNHPQGVSIVTLGPTVCPVPGVCVDCARVCQRRARDQSRARSVTPISTALEASTGHTAPRDRRAWLRHAITGARTYHTIESVCFGSPIARGAQARFELANPARRVSLSERDQLRAFSTGPIVDRPHVLIKCARAFAERRATQVNETEHF